MLGGHRRKGFLGKVLVGYTKSERRGATGSWNLAFRPRIPPRAGASKEYRKRDPKWLDTPYKLDTESGEGGFQGGQVLGKNADGRLMAFKATKVQAVPKDSKKTEFTDEAVIRDIAKYEDARLNLKPWAILAVQFLEKQPGNTGRVREIDRALGLQKAAPMAEFRRWLGKSKQLPLGLYEIFPEYFDIKEETTKEKQGEGSAITLKPERPPIVGESVAAWDGERLGDAPERVEAEAEVPDVPRRYEGESVTEFNKRLLKHYTQDLPKNLRWDKEFSTVEGMRRAIPVVRDLAKLDPIPRPPGLPRP